MSRGRRGSALPPPPVVPSPGTGGLGPLMFIPLPLDHHCGSQKAAAATVTLLRQHHPQVLLPLEARKPPCRSARITGTLGTGTSEDRSQPIPGSVSQCPVQGSAGMAFNVSLLLCRSSVVLLRLLPFHTFLILSWGPGQ